MRFTKYIILSAVVLSGCSEKKENPQTGNNTNAVPPAPPGTKTPPEVFAEEYQRVMKEVKAIKADEIFRYESGALECKVEKFIIGEREFTFNDSRHGYTCKNDQSDAVAYRVGFIPHISDASKIAAQIAFMRAVAKTPLSEYFEILSAPQAVKFLFGGQSPGFCDLVTYVEPHGHMISQHKTRARHANVIADAISIVQTLHATGFCMLSPSVTASYLFDVFDEHCLVQLNPLNEFTPLVKELRVNENRTPAAGSSLAPEIKPLNHRAEDLYYVIRAFTAPYSKLHYSDHEINKALSALDEAVARIRDKPEEVPDYKTFIEAFRTIARK